MIVLDKFVDKFNIYDLFSMLIPGIGICTLFGISLSLEFYDIWKSYGNAKYAIFFIGSYFCGVIFHELGAVADKYFLHKIIYGGNPRGEYFKQKTPGIFLPVIILDDKYFFNNVKTLHNYIINKYVSVQEELVTWKKREAEESINRTDVNNNDSHLNSLVFGYCLNIAENNNFAGKYKNMNVISEMCRSLFLGCLLAIILNKIMIIVNPCHYIYYNINILLLTIFGYVFIRRKVRYERYQIRILLREVYLYFKEKGEI